MIVMLSPSRQDNCITLKELWGHFPAHLLNWIKWEKNLYYLGCFADVLNMHTISTTGQSVIIEIIIIIVLWMVNCVCVNIIHLFIISIHIIAKSLVRVRSTLKWILKL